MLGSDIRIWNRKADSIVKRERIFGQYLKEQEGIGQQCEAILKFDQLFVGEKEHRASLEQCKEQSARTAAKIRLHL
jgi:hypothetical protein